jgi:hypothetical protein
MKKLRIKISYGCPQKERQEFADGTTIKMNYRCQKERREFGHGGGLENFRDKYSRL